LRLLRAGAVGIRLDVAAGGRRVAVLRLGRIVGRHGGQQILLVGSVVEIPLEEGVVIGHGCVGDDKELRTEGVVR